MTTSTSRRSAAGATVALDATRRGPDGRGPARDLGCTPVVLAAPRRPLRPSPEPTAANLQTFAAIVPPSARPSASGQDPDADRLAIVGTTGRYIGEELTLALAASHRLGAARGPVVLNLSTSRAAEDIAIGHGCPVVRTPVGEIHVVERMKAVSRPCSAARATAA